MYAFTLRSDVISSIKIPSQGSKGEGAGTRVVVAWRALSAPNTALGAPAGGQGGSVATGMVHVVRPCLVASRASLPQDWPPHPRNVADSCELTVTTEQMEPSISLDRVVQAEVLGGQGESVATGMVHVVRPMQPRTNPK